MTVKTQRKTSAAHKPSKVGTRRNGRGSVSKVPSKTNGKYPLAAYEHLHIGIVKAAPDGRYIDVNDEFCRILGYTRKELLKLSVKDCTHEEDYILDIKLHEQLVAGKIPFYGLEKRYVRKDGKVVWVELTRSLVRDEDGKPLCTLGAVIDISDRKQVERVLRESAEHLRLATEAARMFKWELDLQKQLYTFADNFVQVLGFSAGLLPQNSVEAVWKLSPAEDVQVLSAAIAQAIEHHGDLTSLQYRVINPEDGQVVWLEVSAKVVYDEQGQAQRMFGVAQNITASKNAQEEIQTISIMSAENPHPIMRLTPAGEVLYANVPARMLLESWKRQSAQTLPEELQQCITEVFGSGVKKQIEIEYEKQVFACTLVPIRAAGHINFYGNDITERKHAAQALSEFARQQEALYQLSDQLHHTASFEEVYNSALTAILSGLQCDRASILLYDETGVMRFVAWRGLSEGYRKVTEGHSPWEADEQNPYPICISDIRTADLSDALKAAIQAEGIEALAFIPLISNGKLIGKFMVYFNTPHDCSDVEIELGLMIARQLAFGVEQKRAEVQLRESEERFRVLADSAPILIWVNGLDGGCEFVNKEYLRFFGKRLEEVLGFGWQPSLHPEDQDAYLQAYLAAFHARVPFRAEARILNAQGEYRWLDSYGMPRYGAAGEFLGYNGISYDVTERKNTEERLRRSAEFDAFRVALTDALRPLNDPEKILAEAMRMLGEKLQVDRVLYSEIGSDDETILILDNYVKDGVLNLSGHASLKDYGKARGRLSAGKNLIVEDAVTSSDMDEKDRASFAALGIKSGLAIPLIKDGRWAATLGVHHGAVRNWTENQIKFVEETAERTWSALERARAQERLRASEALYRTIARSIPGGGVYVVDKDFRYLIAEGSVTEAFGLSREMLEGHTVSEVFPDERGTRMEERLRRVFAGETIGFETKNNGSVFWTQLAPLLDSIGQVIILTIDITERKRAEEALRQSEERFVRFMQHLPGLAWIKDLHGRYVYANAAAEKAFRAPREKLYGKIDPEIFPSQVAAEYRKNDQQALISEKGMQTIETLHQDDGILHYSLVTKFPIPGLDGKPALIGGTAFDITERLQAEEALRKSEERYRTLFDLVPIAVYTCDADGLIQEYNQRAVELWGREPKTNDPSERYCGSYKLYFPDGTFMPHQDCPMSQVLAGRSPERTEVELMIERPDGSRRTIIAHPLLLRDERGRIAGAINCFYDITERRQAIQALYESEERFKAILSQATAGIVRKDADGRFIFVNQAFCSMVGYTEADLLGKPFWQFVYEEDREENKRLYERLMMEGVPFKLEKRLIRRDGSIIWVDVSVSPVMDAEGNPQSAVAVEVDISGRKRAEEALQQLNLQLESRVQRRTATIQAMNQSLREEITERTRIEAALRLSEATARESEEKLRTLFDLLPVGISFLDPKGRIIQMNSALANIVHLSKDQLMNQSYKLRKYIRADGTPMLLEEFASVRALTENRTIYNVETGVVLENGDVVWTSVSAAPVDVADVSVVVVTVDITESKRAEQALQESHGRLRILSQRLVEVQEEERRALARELHDRVGQTLAALNINLIIINGQLTGEAVQQVGPRLNDSMKLVAETIALVRDVMTDLRPPVLDDYGLEAALESQLSKFTSRYNIKAVFERPNPPLPRLGPSIEMTFLRIAQEALMNIARHAHAEHVSLTLWQAEESVCLTIQDDGIGIESWQEANRPGSHGLTIMRERADAFDGKLKVSSVPGQGTMVEVSIPFKNDGQDRTRKEEQL